MLEPVDGYGGTGIMIGTEASDVELEQAAVALRANPAGFIAQETVPISTHPTFTGAGLEPRVVDLRAFVVLGAAPQVLPDTADSGRARGQRRGQLVARWRLEGALTRT